MSNAADPTPPDPELARARAANALPRVLMVLTYYLPHTSGLTIYVQRLAEAMAASGVEVTVLASRHLPVLPLEESLNGVRIVRAPVLFRLHKGVVSPAFLALALRWCGQVDVVHLHLPLLEGAAVALFARLRRRPVVLTYHCDLRLPSSLWSRSILGIMGAMHRLAGQLSHRVVTYTRDYAEHSPFVSGFLAKATTILPPVVMKAATDEAAAALQQRLGAAGPRIGFAGRFAAEKGVEHLIATIPLVAARFPRVRYVFAGEYAQVVGERHFERLQPLLQQHRDRLVFLGNLDQVQLAAFYQSIDALVLPSTNSTESFGLVQVEAMLCGTPVVASDLPGVRQPVRLTGMGETAAPGDEADLAGALIRVLATPERYRRPRQEIEQLFRLDDTVSAYLSLYQQVRALPGTRRPAESLSVEGEPRA